MMFLAWCHFLFLSVVVNPETEKINKIPFCCKKKIGESGGKFWVIQIFIFISPGPSPSLACLPVTSELIAKNFSSTPPLLANSPLSLKVRKNEFLSLPATPPVRSSRWRIRSVLAIILEYLVDIRLDIFPLPELSQSLSPLRSDYSFTAPVNLLTFYPQAFLKQGQNIFLSFH